MAAPAVTGRVYNELHPDLASKWSLATADAAVTAHERGQFSASARLIDAMGRDDRIVAVTGTRIQALLGLDFSMLPCEDADEGENEARGTKEAEELEKTFFKYADEEVQREALRWRIHLGFAIGEVIWRDEAGRLKDEPQRVKIWHPQFCRWDSMSERFMVQTLDAGEVAVEHGNGKWVIFGNGQRPWMNGAVRSLWLLWLLRQFGWRDLGVFGTRTAQGILKAKVPTTPEGERSRLVASLVSVWRGIVAELPQGTEKDDIAHDLEMLETGQDEAVLVSLLERTDMGIAIRMLGQNLTTEVSGDGARSATTAHDRIRIDYLKADAEGFSTDWRTGVLAPLSERKYGDRELAPHPHWDADPPEDEKATAEGQEAAGKAVAAWQTAGYDVENVDEVAERHGLKVKKRPEPKIDPNAPPGAPGAAPPGGIGGGARPGQPPQPGKAPGPARAPVPGRPLAATLLAEGDEDPGFRQGQEYVDNMVASGRQRASEALATDIANILRIVQASESPEALRAGLAALYADSTPTELGFVLERARMMAELAGKYSVVEDVMGDQQQ